MSCENCCLACNTAAEQGVEWLCPLQSCSVQCAVTAHWLCSPPNIAITTPVCKLRPRHRKLLPGYVTFAVFPTDKSRTGTAVHASRPALRRGGGGGRAAAAGN